MSVAVALAVPVPVAARRLLVDHSDRCRLGDTQLFRVTTFPDTLNSYGRKYLKLVPIDNDGNDGNESPNGVPFATPTFRSYSNMLCNILNLHVFDFLQVYVHAVRGTPSHVLYNVGDLALYQFFTVKRALVYIDIECARRQLRAKGYLNNEHEFANIILNVRNGDALQYSRSADPVMQSLHYWDLSILAAFAPAPTPLVWPPLALLPYQRRGVAWMRHIESVLPIAMAFNGCTEIIDGELWLVDSKNKTTLSRQPTDDAVVHSEFWGALLALPIGSGKTSIAVSLVTPAASAVAVAPLGITPTSSVNRVLLYETTATLIVVPDQLLSHWECELARWGRTLRVHVCSKKIHHDALTYSTLSRFDVVLVTRAFMVSASYLSFVVGEIRAMCPSLPGYGMTSMSDVNMHLTRRALFHAATTCNAGAGDGDGDGDGDVWQTARVHKRRPVFSFVLWRRLIVDEIHEWMMSDRDRTRRIGVRHGSLDNLYARARWGITATPTINESATMRQYTDFLTTSPFDANQYTVTSNDWSQITLTPVAVRSVHSALVLDTQNSSLHWPNVNNADGVLENVGTMRVQYIVTKVALLLEETEIVTAVIRNYHQGVDSQRIAEMVRVTFQSLNDTAWQRTGVRQISEGHSQSSILVPWFTVDEMRTLILQRYGTSSMLTFANNSLNAATATATNRNNGMTNGDAGDGDAGDGNGDNEMAVVGGDDAGDDGDDGDNGDDDDGDVCPVCREPDNALDISLPCCHWFCYACCETTSKIAASQHQTATCPVCRAPFLLSQCMRLRLPSSSHNSGVVQPPAPASRPSTTITIEMMRKVYGSKACVLLHMVLTAPENAAFLVVSQYNAVSKALVRIMREQRVSCAMVIGTSDQRNLAIRRYKERLVRVLFVTTDAGCSGLHLPETTHIVFTHPLHSRTTESTDAKYRQLVGRMLRPGNPRISVFITSLVTGTETSPPLTGFLDTAHFTRASRETHDFDFSQASANVTYTLAASNVVGFGKLSARSLLDANTVGAIGGGGGGASAP